MTHGIRGIALVLIPLLAATACIQAPVRVTVLTVDEAGLLEAETFARIPPPWEHPQAGAAIEAEIDKVLERKGFRSVPVEEADFVVSYRGRSVERVRRRTVSDIDATYHVRERYIEGTLEIDVFHPETGAILWRGIGEIDVVSEPAIPQAARKAVRAVLEDFPPEPEAESP